MSKPLPCTDKNVKTTDSRIGTSRIGGLTIQNKSGKSFGLIHFCPRGGRHETVVLYITDIVLILPCQLVLLSIDRGPFGVALSYSLSGLSGRPNWRHSYPVDLLLQGKVTDGYGGRLLHERRAHSCRARRSQRRHDCPRGRGRSSSRWRG